MGKHKLQGRKKRKTKRQTQNNKTGNSEEQTVKSEKLMKAGMQNWKRAKCRSAKGESVNLERIDGEVEKEGLV